MESLAARTAPPAEPAPGSWWRARRHQLLAIAGRQTPAYAYDLDVITQQARRLKGMRHASRLFYAVKANPHPEVLRVVEAQGFGFECVSAGEIEQVREALPALPATRVLFTPNFAPREEYELALAWGALVTIDGLYPLEHWSELLAGRRVLLRVDPGVGAGHHDSVRTAGPSTKFGLEPRQADQALALARRAGIRVVGLHAHAGSGITDSSFWARLADPLVRIARRWREVHILDLGGGLAVPEDESAPRFDLASLDRVLAGVRRRLPRVETWLEPGRFLVAEAGVLLARVTQTKEKGGEHFTGIDAGMNTLLRPALYGARHPIHNLTRADDPRRRETHVVGPVCESGDFFARGCRLPPCREGDVLVIGNAGAYGRVMASSYNGRLPAGEATLSGGELIRAANRGRAGEGSTIDRAGE